MIKTISTLNIWMKSILVSIFSWRAQVRINLYETRESFTAFPSLCHFFFFFFLYKTCPLFLLVPILSSFPGGSDSKESICNVGDLGLIPEWGRSPRKRHSNPLQCSWLEKFHGQRNVVIYSPWGCRVRHN